MADPQIWDQTEFGDQTVCLELCEWITTNYLSESCVKCAQKGCTQVWSQKLEPKLWVVHRFWREKLEPKIFQCITLNYLRESSCQVWERRVMINGFLLSLKVVWSYFEFEDVQKWTCEIGWDSPNQHASATSAPETLGQDNDSGYPTDIGTTLDCLFSW